MLESRFCPDQSIFIFHRQGTASFGSSVVTLERGPTRIRGSGQYGVVLSAGQLLGDDQYFSSPLQPYYHRIPMRLAPFH